MPQCLTLNLWLFTYIGLYIKYYVSLQRPCHVSVFIRLSSIAETRYLSRVAPCQFSLNPPAVKFCLQVLQFSSVRMVPPTHHIRLNLNTTFTRRPRRWRMEGCEKRAVFCGAKDRKKTLTFLVFKGIRSSHIISGEIVTQYFIKCEKDTTKFETTLLHTKTKLDC